MSQLLAAPGIDPSNNEDAFPPRRNSFEQAEIEKQIRRHQGSQNNLHLPNVSYDFKPPASNLTGPAGGANKVKDGANGKVGT